jgi:hypothetical protein
MERRINIKINEYFTHFKNDLRNKILEYNFDDKNKVNDLIEFIIEYNRLYIVKEDLSKRKRLKNSIPASNRCNAKRANNEQCTRRRKEGSEYCGTHAKGTPNGFLNNNECNDCMKKLEVYAEEINGIVYYIDSFLNVYKSEDIMTGKENPTIIGKCKKINNTYTINF